MSNGLIVNFISGYHCYSATMPTHKAFSGVSVLSGCHSALLTMMSMPGCCICLRKRIQWEIRFKPGGFIFPFEVRMQAHRLEIFWQEIFICIHVDSK